MIQFAPTGVGGKAFSIEMHHKSVAKAGPGDNVGINVKSLPKENMPKVGDVCFIVGEDGDDSPPAAAAEFKAAVFVQDHPGQLRCANDQGKGGFTPSIHVRTAKAPCQMIKILWKRGKSTSNVKVKNHNSLKPVTKLKLSSSQRCHFAWMPTMCASLWAEWL